MSDRLDAKLKEIFLNDSYFNIIIFLSNTNIIYLILTTIDQISKPQEKEHKI